MPEPPGRTRFRKGLLPRRLFLALLALFSLAGPLLVFREAARDPLEMIPCGRPAPNEKLGDPVIILSVMGRAWVRWDVGDLARHDDRVFAPYPDSWTLGEPWLMPALVGYPWARLTGSPALGYNVPYFLAAAVACFAAGLLLSDLAGAGWAALVGALLFAWCPARLNNFGVLGTIWGGFLPLVLLFALRFLRGGRPRNAVLAAAAFVVTGLGSLYPLLMGSVVVAFLSVAVARSARRLALLAAAFLPAGALLAAWYAPYLHLARDFDAPSGVARVEAQAADLLALFHTGVFAGPLRDVLDSLLPGFPEGASACFPSLSVLAAFAVAAVLLRRSPRREPAVGHVARSGRERLRAKAAVRSPWPWLLLATLSFVLALGPTVRLAGRPLFIGPYRLLAELPGFSGLRGLNRWDQWFALGVVAAATILLGRLLRRASPRAGALLLAGLVPLLVLDLWTRSVPAQPVPPPSPVDRFIRALPRDAIVAAFPYDRDTADRSWGEQLSHGRRVVTGFQSVPPPIHAWLAAFLKGKPFEAAFAVYGELGASAIEVDLGVIPRGEGLRIHELLSAGALPGVTSAVRSGSRLLILLEPRPPVLLDSRSLAGLRFAGATAVAARSPGRLLFRLGSGRVEVDVVASDGRSRDVLRIPVVGSGDLEASLSRPLPPGAIVREAKSGREIGR